MTSPSLWPEAGVPDGGLALPSEAALMTAHEPPSSSVAAQMFAPSPEIAVT